ncbi:MAG: hypothetical protein M3Z66_16715 [Chloroflexota bacterium]|nr:hypothetical protein [Chloroflexota bacterium]
MTTENDRTSRDPIAATDTNTMADGDGGIDTTRAADTLGGATGVANAEFGTSGPPAETILTPEQLAQTEVIGGAGLDPEAISGHKLDGYFNEESNSTGS